MKNINQAPLGFRLWRMDCEGHLHSAAVDSLWSEYDKVHSSYCFYEYHDSPGSSCECGFNVFYTIPRERVLNRTSPFAVWGAVLGAGDIRTHIHGFRSAEAQIIALYIPQNYLEDHPEDKRLYKELVYLTGERYRVPVFETRREFLQFVETNGKILNEKSVGSIIIARSIGPGFVAPVGKSYLSNNWKNLEVKLWSYPPSVTLKNLRAFRAATEARIGKDDEPKPGRWARFKAWLTRKQIDTNPPDDPSQSRIQVVQ